jgi:hypothetical protein
MKRVYITTIDEEFEKGGHPPGWIGARRPEDTSEKKRSAKRAARERKVEKKEDEELYGTSES